MVQRTLTGRGELALCPLTVNKLEGGPLFNVRSVDAEGRAKAVRVPDGKGNGCAENEQRLLKDQLKPFTKETSKVK